MDLIDIYKTETLSESQVFALENFLFVKVCEHVEESLLGLLVAQRHVDGADAQKEREKLRAPKKKTISISES